MKVGQKVYLLKVGNNARYCRDLESRIVESEVTKIGRKYFYVDYMDAVFRINDLQEHYKDHRSFEAFMSKQDIYNKKEADRLTLKFTRVNYFNGLSLDQLKRIEAIANESKNKINFEKYGFVKQEKSFAVGWRYYFLDSINPNYPYYLEASLHYPVKVFMDSDNIEHRNVKIYLHRHPLNSVEDLSIQEESKPVYEGLIESDSDLEFILKKTQIIDETKT